MNCLLEGLASRLPSAWHYDSFVGCFAGPGNGSEPDGYSLPSRPVAGGWTSQGMGNLMQERVEYRFVWALLGIIASYLDAFQVELASAPPTPQHPCDEPSGRLLAGFFIFRRLRRVVKQ